ncbi:MAG: efflux RND transporter permease subunit [Alphaproteobacteria bacterium]|nr:efflux RND transporter permease subunit [Alphaproteobacteria bacterium]
MINFNLSAFAVRERAITLFLLVALLGAGIFAFTKLGRAEDPSFTVKVMTVSAVWPGATAQEMQDLVADPLEKRLQELRWYDHVDTYTRPGFALMTLFLKDNMPPAEVPEQFYQARKKLGDEAHELPSGVAGPFVNDEYSDVTFALYALKSKGLPPRQLVREAEDLREDLLHVAGVKKVDIYGERPERIFVEFSYARLTNLGIKPQDVFSALNSQNAVTPSGSIDTNGPQVFIRMNGAYDDLDKIKNTPIAANGRVFKLSDIADVKRGYEDPPTFLIHNNGEPALVLGVVMRKGWNGLVLGKSLEREEKKISASLPVGISFTKISDQSKIIKAAIDEFMMKFMVALGVVMLVSLLSMGWRVGIVVAAAVPLTLAIVMVIMLGTGRDLDRITLGSLIIALGLLVDDAIIAIETMVVRLEEGFDKIKAASYAWSHTAAPMFSGTLVTIIGFLPIGFARSTAGEYAGNIFWIVGYALLTSWVVAVYFTPYLGVKLLPEIKKIEGGHAAIYNTPNYNRFRQMVVWAVDHKKKVALMVLGLFLLAGFGMGSVKQQFFPSSDRSEVLTEVQLPEGSSIEATKAAVSKVEKWLAQQPEAQTVGAYIGGGAPRFFLAYNPELPDPSFAKIIIRTPDDKARDRLIWNFRKAIVAGLAPEAHVRVSQFVFGPYSLYPVVFRVMGPDSGKLRDIADQVEAVMRDNPHTREINQDWGERVPQVHFTFDQARLSSIGLTPHDAAQQLQFLLNGVPVTQVREDIRSVEVVARSNSASRLDPAKLASLTLTSHDGHLIPLSQVGHVDIREEDPILRRRDRTPTIDVRCDIAEGLQPPQVSTEISKALQPIIAKLPPGYRIEAGGNIEDSAKANKALAPIFPIMIVLTLFVIVVQVRSLSMMAMVFLTGPLGLIGTVPVLLLFHQPFGFNAILGLIGLSGILMRNTLILIGQIQHNQSEGLDPYHAVIEATVQRSRPVILTALAAALAFIPLTHSVFWGSMAYTLIGGTVGGTGLILFFLPALYALWFKIKPVPSTQPDKV